MPYAVFGRRGELGRVTHRTTPEAAVAIGRQMQADGFTEVSVRAQFKAPEPIDSFAASVGWAPKDGSAGSEELTGAAPQP